MPHVQRWQDRLGIEAGPLLLATRPKLHRSNEQIEVYGVGEGPRDSLRNIFWNYEPVTGSDQVLNSSVKASIRSETISRVDIVYITGAIY